jgi:hypothetical protein
MPNLHIPADGSLDVEVLNTAVTLDAVAFGLQPLRRRGTTAKAADI